MPSDPFVILGIEKGASQSEILEAYKTKRAYYQQHVFDEGEAGADAARMLELLDTAYQDAMTYTHEHAEVSGEPSEGQNAYQEVRAAISSKDFSKAQSLLDDMYYRGGEWHYYQAIIFYEKNWLNESKKQLELAVDLDPVIARNQPDAKEILQIAQIFHLVSGAGRMKRQPLFKVKSAFDIHR